MVGCYACDFTREAYPEIKKLVARSGASFTFLDYPVKTRTDLMTRVGQCVYRQDPAKYWQLNDLLFTTDKPNLDDEDFALKTVAGLGLDAAQVKQCVDDPLTEDLIKGQLSQITKTNFYGTPTIFINDQVYVGPKPYRVYAVALEGLLYWLK